MYRIAARAMDNATGAWLEKLSELQYQEMAAVYEPPSTRLGATQEVDEFLAAIDTQLNQLQVKDGVGDAGVDQSGTGDSGDGPAGAGESGAAGAGESDAGGAEDGAVLESARQMLG